MLRGGILAHFHAARVFWRRRANLPPWRMSERFRMPGKARAPGAAPSCRSRYCSRRRAIAAGARELRDASADAEARDSGPPRTTSRDRGRCRAASSPDFQYLTAAVLCKPPEMPSSRRGSHRSCARADGVQSCAMPGPRRALDRMKKTRLLLPTRFLSGRIAPDSSTTKLRFEIRPPEPKCGGPANFRKGKEICVFMYWILSAFCHLRRLEISGPRRP